MPTVPTYRDNVASIADAIFARIKRERWEFIKLAFPAYTIGHWEVGSSNKCLLNPNTNTVGSSSSTSWACYWTKLKVPKWTLVHITVKYSTAHAIRFAICDSSPQDYYTSHSNSIIGAPFSQLLYNESLTDVDVWFELPREAYIIYSRTTSNVTQSLAINYYPIDAYKTGTT